MCEEEADGNPTNSAHRKGSSDREYLHRVFEECGLETTAKLSVVAMRS